MNSETSCARRLTLRSFSTPPDLVLEQIPVPVPGPGQLLLEMLHAPVNPADLNILEGKYGELPELPAGVGNEGVGRVAAVGPGVRGWQTGDLALPLTRGTWSTHLLVEAERAFRLPGDVNLQQASMLSVNPATAWLMLKECVPLQEGEWVVQNAANSGVGRCVVQLARVMGLRVFSVVRRPELIEELSRLGSTAVATEESDFKSMAKEIFGSSPPRLALNAVGGTSALNLANLLARDGVLVTYGAMSKQPLKIPNGLLIFKNITFRGFWLTRWLREASADARQAMYNELAALCREGRLHQPVAAELPLGDFQAALEAASREARAGKVLLRLSP